MSAYATILTRHPLRNIFGCQKHKKKKNLVMCYWFIYSFELTTPFPLSKCHLKTAAK